MSEHGTIRIVRVAVALVLSAALGCQNELFSDSMTPHTASPERLREVGTFDPVRESSIPARTLAEASKDLAADRLPGQKPPPMREMTLAACRLLALERNLDLRVQLFNPSLAESAVGVEMAKFETSIFSNYNRNDQNLVSSVLGGEGLARDTFGTGLTVPLATGGTVDLSAQSILAEQDLAGLIPASQDNQSGLQFSIAQPLLRGAGIEANTASIRVAKLNSQIADARTKLEAIRVLANVDRAYWNLYSATRELEVRLQQYELAVVQLELARRLVKAGQTAEVEIIRAESGVGSRLEAIILADNVVRLRQRDLKRIMNDPELPLDGTTYVATKTLPSPISLQFDPERMSTKAIDNRMEMLELELQLSIDANNIDLARNQALPLFTVDYTYQYFGYGTSFVQSWDSIGDADQYSLTANARIPLGNEAAKNRVQGAILTRLQRLATRDQRRLSIRQEVLNAMDNLENSWRRILAARLETALAGRTYEAEKRQFDVGLRTSIDVLDAAARLGDAQSREVRALATWQISLVDLAFATGTQLGQARIDWSEVLPIPSAREAVQGMGAWGFNESGVEGNQPDPSDVKPLSEEELKALEMPVTAQGVLPSQGLGTKPSERQLGPQRAPPAPDLGVKPVPPPTISQPKSPSTLPTGRTTTPTPAPNAGAQPVAPPPTVPPPSGG
ncbi:MAG: TolC family protein [Planctomycetes bacterium]|nr:TolC family protein [Planctomycetota bacterium]